MKYIIGLSCSGEGESETQIINLQIIEAESETEAVKEYNKINKCSYYYGTSLGVATEENVSLLEKIYKKIEQPAKQNPSIMFNSVTDAVRYVVKNKLNVSDGQYKLVFIKKAQYSYCHIVCLATDIINDTIEEYTIVDYLKVKKLKFPTKTIDSLGGLREAIEDITGQDLYYTAFIDDHDFSRMSILVDTITTEGYAVALHDFLLEEEDIYYIDDELYLVSPE